MVHERTSDLSSIFDREGTEQLWQSISKTFMKSDSPKHQFMSYNDNMLTSVRNETKWRER
jgi:hypothetical protein